MAQSPPTSFILTVYNTPPYFSTGTLSDRTMRFNTTYRYYLPPIRDDENNTVQMIIDSVPSGLMSFTATNFDNEFLEFYPNEWKFLGEYTVAVTLTDGNKKSSAYFFKLRVINKPPYFI